MMKLTDLSFVVLVFVVSASAQSSIFDIKCGVEEMRDEVLEKVATLTQNMETVTKNMEKVTQNMETVGEQMGSVHQSMETLDKKVSSIQQNKDNEIKCQQHMVKLEDKIDGLKDLLERVVPNTACKSGWSRYKDKCFRIFDSTLNWSQSKASCEGENGNLASIPDIGTNDFIYNLPTTGHYIWIGGSQTSGSAPWEWTDQSPWGFENWLTGEPNAMYRNSENCASFYTINSRGDNKKQWNDLSCHRLTPYVCEKPA